jgi:tRNA-specific 2-thiouridylase
VVAAMSGGVDSSVAACLLVEQGYDVTGLFMRVGASEPPEPSERAAGFSPRGSNQPSGLAPPGSDRPADLDSCADPRGLKPAAHQGCCSANDAHDARFVAGMLGIPFYALDFQEDFDRLIDYFADEYVRGRTPNPCILCNDRFKFGKLLDYADAAGARYVATGHYARLGERQGHRILMRARDTRKDQSYVLFGVDRAILDRVMFPVGDLTKPQVRELAARFGLPNRDKPESMEICFAPDRDYARVVRERRPEAFVEGDVVDQDGRLAGRHRGLGHYTIGQRRGLGIAAGKPIYVTELNAAENTVTVGDRDALLKPALVAERTNFLADVGNGPFRADVKIRYLHTAAPATVYPLERGRVRVVFDEPQRAVTPGQAVVFYDGDVVLGGGWIERAEAEVVAVPPTETASV